MANRPQIDPERKQAATFSVMVRMTPKQSEQLKNFAAKRKETVSRTIRFLIEEATK